jgi:hypothetical protein
MATWDINVTGTIDPNAKSTGGNGDADAGKLLEFGVDGSIQAKTGTGGGAAVYGETDALTSAAVEGYSTQNGEGGRFQSVNGEGVSASSGQEAAIRGTNDSTAKPTLHTNNTDETNAGPLAWLHNANDEGVEVANDGSLDWTTATGASATRTNLGLGDLAVKDTVATGDIDDNVVTNAILANMATATIKGRATAGTGDPEDLTASQARTVLGLGTAALVNTGTGSGDVPTITQADARYRPIQVTGLTLTAGGWSLVSGLYEQSLSNVNITTASIVDVIPDNDDAEVVADASFLPRTDSASGSVKVYAKNLPSADIGVTINIIST